jgi:hypothetical protein
MVQQDMPVSHGRALSILIPSLRQRAPLLARLRSDLDAQIAACGAGGRVEVLTDVDAGEKPIGEKRNRLLEAATGDFVVFVDDDDRLSPRYVRSVLAAIDSNPLADCVCFPAEVRFRGGHPHLMVHAIESTQWHFRGGQYRRPPSHITPIRRSIASNFAFEPVSHSEDIDWSLRISAAGALTDAVTIDEVLYFYDCARPWPVQWLTDRTQGIRHALGLRRANLLVLRRKWR